MNTTFRFEDARGSMEIEELAPGHLRVRVEGHLTARVGSEFPLFARMAAEHADSCVVYLDARGLNGFDPAVRDAWLEVVLLEREHIDRIVTATRGVFISLSARAAGLMLRSVGVDFEVSNSSAEFDALVTSVPREDLRRAA
ncbi:MAG: hypothetical protein U0228_19620 [Myxococcaceae bacterium]